MKKWFQRLFSSRPQAPLRVLSVPMTDLRLSQVRADLKMTNAFAKIINTGDFQVMLCVLRTEHPAYLVADMGTPLPDRAILQARCEGYTLCLSNLEALGKHVKPSSVPEAEFAPEELMKD